LCGLADGLDALRHQGVNARRALLIGGAARSPAVSQIASEVFGIDGEVPAAGEYVALGAARQAAWALRGSRPDWVVSSLALPRATVPSIRQQYAQRKPW